jgi:hypothetical protein
MVDGGWMGIDVHVGRQACPHVELDIGVGRHGVLALRYAIANLAPEIQLLYQSKSRRPNEDTDFANALPQRQPSARACLRRSLVQTTPNPAWLAHTEW